jgi:hypothetical protein
MTMDEKNGNAPLDVSPVTELAGSAASWPMADGRHA